MKNLKDPSVMGQKIYKLLEKDKILLLQDKSFPNIVSKIVGEKIEGSWWGHPMANPLYNGLGWMEHHHNVLVIKLLDGKVTYIHESLFADIYSIVCKTRDWQLKKLKNEDLDLLKYISKKSKVVLDDLKAKDLVQDLKKSFTNLEKRLLIFSQEEHTESGQHIKEYMPWKKSKIATADLDSCEKAQEKIEKIVAKLNQAADSKVKLPWN